MTNKKAGPEGPNSPSRRNFLAAMGATVASINTAACIRKPMERILPFGQRPEDLVPGKPRYYATAFSVGESVQGLLACSNDGRPTKVEGNPKHPASMGATSSFAQASVLALYDPERSRNPFKGSTPASIADAEAFLASLHSELKGSSGEGFGILTDRTPSPTVERLLAAVLEAMPKAKLFSHDRMGDNHAEAGAAMVGVTDASFTYGDAARVIAAFDADPLGGEGDSLVFTRQFAAGRSPEAKQKNRLYAIEPWLSLTGSSADHRKAVKGAQVSDLLAAVAMHLRSAGLDLPVLKVPDSAMQDPFAKALADDLNGQPKGTTLVLVGERQSPSAHALALLMNRALGNLGKTWVSAEKKRAPRGSMLELASAMTNGAVSTLVVLDANPVYDAAGDVPFADLLEKVKTVVHVGGYRDETGAKATWHIPKSHYLEAWGDLIGRDGTIAIQQPLIAPLYPSFSVPEVLSLLLGEKEAGYELVRATLKPMAQGDFDRSWQTWLHDGIGPKVDAVSVNPTARKIAATWAAAATEGGIEVNFVLDPTVGDGRFGNSPWLQELPDPITKLTWDNAALVSPATAKKLGVKREQVVEIEHHGAKIRMPVFVQVGTADDVIVLPMGYGRTRGGKYAKAGFAVSPLQVEASLAVLTGATVTATRKTYALASTQVQESLEPGFGFDARPLHRQATQADFADDPEFVGRFENIPKDWSPDMKTLLWTEPLETVEVDHRWGMTIDLNSCTGCGACTIACQAENNIPWVGKDQVMNGREMHWIRMDRYFEPAGEQVQVKFQPLNCQQCETAPCEAVCPVAATVHSPEGLNDMVYNRCIGTRYCSNNCPYKVRRFNFFHYTVRNDAEYGLGIAMQRNPDVTVRYRGVMEKCTYCVQRISRARIDAKVNGDGKIKEGEVVTACQQVCAAQAITFGNLDDPKAKVREKANDKRNYSLLAELNTRPRTTYLAKLTNPNPKLTTNG